MDGKQDEGDTSQDTDEEFVTPPDSPGPGKDCSRPPTVSDDDSDRNHCRSLDAFQVTNKGCESCESNTETEGPCRSFDAFQVTNKSCESCESNTETECPCRSLDALQVTNKSCESNTETEREQSGGSLGASAAAPTRQSDLTQGGAPAKPAIEELPTARQHTVQNAQSSADRPGIPSPMQQGRGETSAVISSTSTRSTRVEDRTTRDRRRKARKQNHDARQGVSTSEYKLSSSSSECETEDTVDSLLSEHSPRQSGSRRSGTGGTFVSLDTLRESPEDDPVGIRVHGRLLGFQGAVSHDDLSAKEIVDQMTSRRQCDIQYAQLRHTLLRNKLPRAERELDMRSAAECLKSQDPFVRERAVLCLERILIQHRALRSADLKKRERASDSSGAAAILSVIEVLCCMTDQSGANSQTSCLHGNLILMAACCFLCHPERNREGLQHLLTSLGNKLKKHAQFRHFYQDFQHAVSSDTSFHEDDWEVALQKVEVGSKKLKRASLIQLAQRAFSLIHATVKFGWDRLVKRLGEELLKLIQKLRRRERKIGAKREPRAALQLFLVRCLALALTTAFKEDRKATAQLTCNPPVVVAELIQTVIKDANSSYLDPLLKEVSCLIQHPSEHVRQIGVDILQGRQGSLPEMLRSIVEARLQPLGIRRSGAHQEDERELKRGRVGCAWQEMRWRGPDGQLLHVAIHVPDPGRLASCCTARDCLQHTVSRQRGMQRLQHLEALRRLGPHPNLLSLLVFQARPLPSFYVTEDVFDRRLLYLLIDDRSASSKLHENLLLNTALQVVKALDFLSQKHLVLRDVTTYNMIYVLTKDEHGVTKDITVKIADLGLTHQYKNDDYYANPNIRRQMDPGPVAVRWLPREALFEGLYDESTMVYSLGFVLNELFTRGCQPFTQMSLSTDDILLQLFLNSPSVVACQWPCVTDDVFVLIRWCTMVKPSDRPSLYQLQHDEERGILALLQRVKDTEKKVPTSFPPIDTDQANRGYAPERDVHKVIDILSNTDPYQYTNLRLSNWLSPSKVKVTSKELQAQDELTITKAPGFQATVTESLRPEFVHGDLQELESFRQSLPCVVRWNSCRRLSTKQAHVFKQERVYEDSDTLLGVVKRLSGVVEVSARGGHVHSPAQRRALQLCLNLARALRDLHVHNWLHCDLRAANILITNKGHQVIFARIGRMVHLKGVSSTTGQSFDDNARWTAPEVRNCGIYSKESDVFSLVTTFWEIFNVIITCASNPATPDKHLVPLATVELNNIAKEVERGVELPELQMIPTKLNALIAKGRNPDRLARPDLAEIIQFLEEYVRSLAQWDPHDSTLRLQQPAPTSHRNQKALAKLLPNPRNRLRKSLKKRGEENSADTCTGAGSDIYHTCSDAGSDIYLMPDDLDETLDSDQTIPKWAEPYDPRSLGLSRPFSLGTDIPPPLPKRIMKSACVAVNECLDTRPPPSERPTATNSPVTQLVPLDLSRVSSHGDVVSPLNGRGMVVSPSLLPTSLCTETKDWNEGSDEDQPFYTNTAEYQFRPVIRELSCFQVRHGLKMQNSGSGGKTTRDAAKALRFKRRNADSLVTGSRLGEDRVQSGAVEVEGNQRTKQSTEKVPHTASRVQKAREALDPETNTYQNMPAMNTKKDPETNTYQNMPAMNTNSETVIEANEGKTTVYGNCGLGTESEDFCSALYQNSTEPGRSPVYVNSSDGPHVGCGLDQSAGHALQLYENRVAEDDLGSTQKGYGVPPSSDRPVTRPQTGIPPEEKQGIRSSLDCHLTSTQAALETEKQSDINANDETDIGSAEELHIYTYELVGDPSDPDITLRLMAATEGAAPTESPHERSQNYENVDKSTAARNLTVGNDADVSSSATSRVSVGAVLTAQEGENRVSDDPSSGMTAIPRSSFDAHHARSSSLLRNLKSMFRNRRKKYYLRTS